MFDSKKLAASCAAVASLAMFGLSGTAMAVETPTTSDTATASITLNASEGNTLAGHTGYGREIVDREQDRRHVRQVD